MLNSLEHRIIESSDHRVNELSLTHFRNHASLSLAPEGKNVVITGVNGAGKTNVLEALSLFAPGRGLRTAKLSQLRHHASPSLSWAASLSLCDGTQLGTGQTPQNQEKRQIRCNGEALPAQSDLTAYLSVLWQTPQMDGLFTQGNTEQRRFFDRLVYSFDTDHAARLARYEYFMKERNRLLALPSSDTIWLDTLEQKMAEASIAIAVARLEVLHHLQVAMMELHAAFPRAIIHLHGTVENWLEQGVSALQAEEMLATALRTHRTQDAATGRTSQGAHRMELRVHHQEKKLPAEICSTGEQKALMLSLLLAQCYAMQLKLHRLPVLLLDEVVAHLDATRRLALFQAIRQLGTQAWLTGTDISVMKGISEDALLVTLP
jgi:DNA replication and repair protein RecF